MKLVKRFVTLIILLIAFGAALYTQRVEVSDWLSNVKKPSLPEEVSYEVQIKKEKVVEEKRPFIEFTRLDKTDEAKEKVKKIEEAKKEEVVEKKIVDEKKADDSELVVNDALAAAVNLAVPFTSQAPHANWEFPYKEACEEASVYMTVEFLNGTDPGKIPADKADKDLLKIVEFEKGLFGYYEDTNIAQTRTFAELMYGFEKIEIIENPTVLQIKQRLNSGLPVIVPAAGRELKNPFFTAPGPVYHMLVIRGYTEKDQFIVNDPGTRRGEAYLYDFDILMNAIHDWNNGGEITDGKKAVMIIYPN